MSPFTYNDGGRSRYFKGDAGDCVVRAVAIATEHDYLEVYNAMNQLALRERPRRGRKRSNSRGGVHRATLRRYMENLGGWTWVPTMHIGSGCRVHLRQDELPAGRLIVSVSKHIVAVIDGVVYDTHDPRRDGTRCVYGYWEQDAPPEAPA